MAFALSARSRARLAGVHPDLVRVVHRAIEISPVDFGVIEGVRSEARQRELYAQGRTKPGKKVTWTLNSRHFIQPSTGYGHAVDLCPWVDGAFEWDRPGLWDWLADAMFAAAQDCGQEIRWGADWDRDGKRRERGETDSPHFEIVLP